MLIVDQAYIISKFFFCQSLCTLDHRPSNIDPKNTIGYKNTYIIIQYI